MSSASDTGTSGLIVKCPGCDKAYKVHTEKLPPGINSFPCRSCGTLVSVTRVEVETTPAATEGKVLVVIEEEELGKLVQRILVNGGYRSILVNSGNEALEILKAEIPDLLLVSVYLPDMMGYELFDKLEDAQPGRRIPSILLSSVHHATRYKRAPTSLYGAEDYLERHHLPDLLIPKVRRLLSSEDQSQTGVNPTDLPPPTDEQVLVRRDLETMEKTGQFSEDPQMGAVQRMCRVIAGDIVLYNEDVIKSSSPEDLLDAIASDLSEGEALLMSRFPEMEDQLSYLLRAEMLRLLNSRGIRIS